MKSVRCWALAGALMILAGVSWAQAPSPFSASAQPINAHQILVRLEIPAGHAVYADKTRIQLPDGWRLQSSTVPEVVDDPVGGREYLWRGGAEAILVRDPGAAMPREIEVQVQGCSEAEGVCVPATRLMVPLGA